jgi:heme oxygenase
MDVQEARTIAAAHAGAASHPGTARAMLQRATLDIHESIHHAPAFVRLMAGTSTSPQYSALLRRLLGFHRPLERALRFAADNATTRKREKAYLLRSDLLALGVSRSRIVAIPTCRSLPAVTSPDEVWGCLYVIEGAGLGGKVIARTLDTLLGTHGSAGRRFFLGRPEPDPLPWPCFCRLLESHAAQGDLAAITASARRTFESLALWLAQEDDDA